MTTHNYARETSQRPVWREPMVWLVAAIPALAVIGTVALLVAAARSAGTDDSVADPVHRTAQVQTADLGPDEVARQLGLSVIVRADGRVVEVLPVQGEFDRGAPLALSLHHPARAGLDRGLVLQPNSTGWSRELDLDLSHDWNVQLGPPGGRWRLQGRGRSGQQAASLGPPIGPAR